MNYCPWCGSSIQDYENCQFCPNCGKAVKKDDSVVIGEEVASLTRQEESEESFAEKDKPVLKKKTKRYALMFLAALVLIAVGVFVVVFGTGENVVKRKARAVLYVETYDERGNVLGSGSGFLINNKKTLVTNYHVIEGAYRIIAWTSDKKESAEINTVLAYGKDIDLAVLECTERINASPLQLINSDSVKQGDAVYAVGYPLGIANSLSDGIVSSRYTDEDGLPVLQITAPISPGNSGGPLLNQKGQVVGIVCATYVDGQNMNIAVPSTTLIDLLERESTAQSLLEFFKDNYQLRVAYLQGIWNGRCKVPNCDAESTTSDRAYVGEHHYTLVIEGERAILTDEYQWNGFYPKGVTSKGYTDEISYRIGKIRYGEYKNVFQSYVRIYEGVIQEHKTNKKMCLLVIDERVSGVITKLEDGSFLMEPYDGRDGGIWGKTVFRISE